MGWLPETVGYRTFGRFPDVPPVTTGAPCVYFLLSEERAVYVGRSQQVRKRLRTHWRNREIKPEVVGWSVLVMDTQQSAVSFEKEMIRRWCPLYNKADNPAWRPWRRS